MTDPAEAKAEGDLVARNCREARRILDEAVQGRVWLGPEDQLYRRARYHDTEKARHRSGCTGTTGESTAGQQRAPVLSGGGPHPHEQPKRRRMKTRLTREETT